MQVEKLIAKLERRFPDQDYLSVADIARFLGCDPSVVYHWIKRSNPDERPPRYLVGKETKFDIEEFANWFIREQRASGGTA